MSKEGEKYLWLEALRGFAAIWVLVHHADLTVTAFVGDLGSTFISRGFLGVDFFFILSGFIISFSSRRILESGRGLRTYLASRILRIYLPYLPIGIGLYFAYTFLPNISAANREIGLLTSITLIPTSESTALSVAWTLKHEMLFYFIFSTFFIGYIFHYLVLALWFFAIALELVSGLHYSSPFIDVLLNPLNLWFFVGIIIERLPRNFGSEKALLILTAFTIGALIVFVELGLSRWHVGLMMAIVIYCMTSRQTLSVSTPKLFIYLGSASYSIYLLHNPFQSLIARVLLKIGYNDVIYSFAIISLVSLFFGIIYYLTVEKPSQALSRKILRALEPVKKL